MSSLILQAEGARRILVYGEPGCGVVTSAAEIARSCSLPLYNLSNLASVEDAAQALSEAREANAGYVASLIVLEALPSHCLGGLGWALGRIGLDTAYFNEIKKIGGRQ